VEPERADQIILNVGRRIAEIREELGWTQQQAAEKLKMPVNNLQRMEMGMNLTIRTLVRLAKGFGVPTRSLLDEPASKKRRPGRPRKR
jgi:transcriptional regulator with XRE-family HTH domain